MAESSLSRRTFLTGAALTGTVAIAGLAGCSSSGGSSSSSSSTAAAEGGAAHEWLQPAPELPSISTEEDYDIVVVGAGIAGCTAAQAATEAGAKVLLVEKFGEVTAHGTDIGAVGSQLQAAHGVNIDKDLATRLIYQWGQSQANFYLIKNFVERSGAVMDHYIEMAEKVGYEVILNTEMTARSDWDTLEDRFKQFRTAHKFMLPEGSSLPEQMWNVGYFISMVADDAQANGAVFEFNTTAEQLIKEDGKVTAIVVQNEEGYKKINVSKGVILATGGITDNNEMKECFCPITLRVDQIDYFPEGGNMGDGIKMGKWIGAQLSPCYPAPIIHPVNLSVMGPGFDTCWLTVNRDGMRYCCEVGYEPIVTNARMNTPGSVSWAIWDSHYKEHAQKQEPIKSAAFLDDLDAKVEEAVAGDFFYKGETLEELAKAIGVPYEELQKTVDRYNSFCDAGYDPDFGVPERFLSSVKDGPFYASKVSAWMLALPYGLRVNQDSQVLDEEDSPIGGLFAIGNVQGDFFANSYPVTLPGTSHGRGMTYGYLVGQALANDTTIDGYDAVLTS
ncbi:MAG: FAD-dependent oxidoreductase [Raoultibacter sp.]|jgi:fumarate reductase flavoprotein subunit